MKPGDLVRHPKGMVNVCKERYSTGIVLKVKQPMNPPGLAQCLVFWHTLEGTFLYPVDQLELVQ
jgi:hypothetical protein